MSALPIISEMSDYGISVRIVGNGLALSAPKGTLTPQLLSKLRSKKPALLRSLQEMREKAGSDWEEISSDPAKLKAFTELVMILDMRQRGIVPDHYTSTTECNQCGHVPIFEGCPPLVHGCPWCFNRIKCLPIPGVKE